LIDCGIATLMLLGETECGDQYLVKPFPGGVLVAVIDGLGHGPAAALAAKMAVAQLESHAHESVRWAIEHCHESLRPTRGAVMNLASFSKKDQNMSWLGVGNVEGVLLRADGRARPAREYLVPCRGVVGGRLWPLNSSILPIRRGDTLIFATDGIHSGFGPDVSLSDPPQKIADRILAVYGKDTDDALVLVVRYLGGTT